MAISKSLRDALALSLLVATASAHAQSVIVSGPARIVDGDTLYVGDTKVRLFGIDAPERTQECTSFSGQRWACGLASARALAASVGQSAVICRWDGMRSHDRIVARCEAASVDLARAQVAMGLALDFPRFSRGEYARDEQQARQQPAGIHTGPFMPPWQYRDVTRFIRAEGGR